MARGFSQTEGIDYQETFSPLSRYTSIRTIMALVSMMKWDLHQMDVKTTFLNGVIEDTSNNHKDLKSKTEGPMYVS